MCQRVCVCVRGGYRQGRRYKKPGGGAKQFFCPQKKKTARRARQKNVPLGPAGKKPTRLTCIRLRRAQARAHCADMSGLTIVLTQEIKLATKITYN